MRKKERMDSGYGPNNVLYEDREAQTELDQAMMEAQNDGVVDYSQQNSFQTTQLQ